MNCKNLIIAGFNSGISVFPQYLQQITQIFNSLNPDNNHKLLVVTQEQFITQVLSDPANVGVCIAGSGVTQFAALNRHTGVRAAIINTTYSAQMCRKHNDANIAIIASDCIGSKLSSYLIKNYLINTFCGGQSHKIRIQKLQDLDLKYQKI